MLNTDVVAGAGGLGQGKGDPRDWLSALWAGRRAAVFLSRVSELWW